MSIRRWLKSASRHTVSTSSVFTVFRFCFAWTERIHAFYHIMFVYTPVIQVSTGTLRISSSLRWFIDFFSVYTQLMYTTFFLLCLQSWYTRFIHYRCVYWQLIYIIHPSCRVWDTADIQAASLFFSLYCMRLLIHFFLFSCVYTQLINVFHPSCCVIQSRYRHFATYPVCVDTELIHAFFALWFCLYVADSYILSTFAVFIRSWYTRLVLLVVSIRSWDTPFFPLVPTRSWLTRFHHCRSIGSWSAPFVPSCRVYTQLICSYHHLCNYRQIQYMFALCLLLRAPEVDVHTLSVSVFRYAHFKVCYYIFDACSVSMQFVCMFPPFASKPIGCTPNFALVFTIGHMRLFYALQRVTFRLLLCTQAHDVHVSTPLFRSLYPLPFSQSFVSSSKWRSGYCLSLYLCHKTCACFFAN